MNYLGYVAAAYAIFAGVLLWDFVVPRIGIRQQLRAARLRGMRAAGSARNDTGSPLSRG